MVGQKPFSQVLHIWCTTELQSSSIWKREGWLEASGQGLFRVVKKNQITDSFSVVSHEVSFVWCLSKYIGDCFFLLRSIFYISVDNWLCCVFCPGINLFAMTPSISERVYSGEFKGIVCHPNGCSVPYAIICFKIQKKGNCQLGSCQPGWKLIFFKSSMG